MRAPIIVAEPGTVVVYESVEAAQRAVEAVDVKEGLYHFFDADGFVLRATVVPSYSGLLQKLIGHERVVLEQSEIAPAPEDARALLLDYLAGTVHAGAHEATPIRELATVVLRFQQGRT